MVHKVLIALYDIQDLGGIINWVEHLCHGLKELNVDPVIVRLEDKERCISSRSNRSVGISHSGIPFDQRAGWVFPLKNRISLRSTNWSNFTSQYSLVIWAIPVPSKSKPIKDWQSLYHIRTPQIMVIHDGNLNKLYFHAYEVMDKCSLIVGVHDCAFNSIKVEHKRLIPNPQVLSRMRPINYVCRKYQIFSLQTFKRWKHVDDLIRAVPYMKDTTKVLLAGGGIEYYYMTSKTKRKSCYKDIWERAIQNGMQYLGYVSESQRDKILQESMLLLDPSWSKTYASYGSHFNRTFVDAIISGCLPAGTNLGMDNNSFFTKESYITIPYNSSPQGMAELYDRAVHLGKAEYEEKLLTLQSVVRTHFDSVKVAKEYLEVIS